MVVYDKTYALGANQGASQKANNKYIIAHSTANPDATGKNEASYMKGHFEVAYTHAIADTDRVFVIGEPGYVAWGAGAKANPFSPFQIELAEYSNKTKALAAYKNYVTAIREYAKKYGIPLTLDGSGNGVKTHNWVSHNLGGTDHTDPIAYLAGIGISQAQFTKDLANGVGKAVASKPTTPAKPATSSVPSGFTKESGTFVNGDTPIMNRVGSPSTSAAQGGYLPAYGTWKYDGFIKRGGFTWIHHVYGGKHIYLPVRQWKGNSSTPFGTFK